MRIADSVLITLARQPERRRAFAGWLHGSPGRPGHPLPAGWPQPRAVEGYDAEHIPDVGHAIGCAVSHARTLYQFAAAPGDPADWLLVMEDDARWGPALVEHWPAVAAAVPADAEMLFVGGDVWRPNGRGERLGPRLTRAAGVVRLHCYLVPRRAAAKIAGIVESKPGEHCDRLIAYAAERGELSVVAADPFLVAQRADANTWYAWNPGEPGTTDAGLEVWARTTLGRPKPAPLRLAACKHLGHRLPGQPCGSPLLRCNLHGDVTTRASRCSGADRFCGDCPDHAPPA